MRRLLTLIVLVSQWPFAVEALKDTTAGQDGEITVEVNGIQFTRGGSGPKCRWTRLTQGQMERRLGDPPVFVAPEPLPEVEPLPTDREPTEDEIADREAAEQELDAERKRRAEARAAEEARQAQPSLVLMTQNGEDTDHGMFSAVCADRNIPANFIALDTPRPVLLQALRDYATAQIELPVSNINPSLEAGGVVNLGMWLAIVPQEPIEPITAEIPGEWVTASPAHDSVAFKMGDGSEPVRCDGPGIPIPAAAINEVDPSPTCGYTYRQSSFDDAPYQISIDTTWVIPYESSTESGTLDPFTRTATFEYDVDEIQTVGTG